MNAVRAASILVVLVILGGMPARAGQDGTSIIVFDLEAKGVDETLARNATDVLLTALKAQPGYRVMGREEIKLLLEHEKLKTSLGCTDDSCLAKIGEALKGDLVISGAIGQVGKAYLATIRLVDVRNAAVIGRASVTALTPDDLLKAAERLAAPLFSPEERQKEAPSFSLALGEEAVKIAVLDLKASGADEKAVENLTQVVVHEVKNFKGVAVISRDEIKSMLLHEQSKMLMGCDDESCMAEIGGALGVQYIVSGNVGRMGETYLLHLKLINIREAKVENRVAEVFQGEESQLIAAARFAARSLIGHQQSGDGKLQVRPSVSDAKVFLAGKEVELASEQAIKAGKYNLRLEVTGYHPWIGDVYVEEGQLTRLDVAMSELQLPADYGVYKWTALGIGAAGLVLGVSGTGLANYYQNQADSTGDQGEFDDYNDSVGTWNNVSLAGYITGGALLATALVLFLLDPGGESDETEQSELSQPPVSVAPLPDGGLIMQTGFRF